MKPKRFYQVIARGDFYRWAFYAWGTKRDAQAWREDGLEVNEVVAVIPEWAVRLGLARVWAFFDEWLTRGLRTSARG